MTLDELRAKSPFPWTQEVNYDRLGGVRMLDAKGVEVELLDIVGFCAFATTLQFTPAKPAEPQGNPA